MLEAHTFEPLVAVMFIYEHIVCRATLEAFYTSSGGRRVLFWVSLGWWYEGVAKLKFDICELWGSSRRTVGSFDMVMDISRQDGRIQLEAMPGRATRQVRG